MPRNGRAKRMKSSGSAVGIRGDMSNVRYPGSGGHRKRDGRHGSRYTTAMRAAATGSPGTDPEPREREMAARPLTETFDVRRDARVAVIGGGGKKTLIFALAREWAK